MRRREGLRGGVTINVAAGVVAVSAIIINAIINAIIEPIRCPIAESRYRPPVRAPKTERAIGVMPDPKATLVQQPVMIRAEQREVLETRGAAVGPMVNMMCIHIVRALAARKRTAAIA